jgi:RND family efflux transporter MFP subunit
MIVANAVRRLSVPMRAGVVAAILFLSGGGVYGVVHYSRHSPTAPTFNVKRGEFLDVIQLRGQIKATKSVTLTAPSDAGELQILKIVANGTYVKPGDVVVEFDKSKTDQDMAQDQSTLKSAQAEIEQTRAQAVLKEEDDTAAVTKAQFAVETAKLDAGKQEIVSKIEGDEANLKVADAEQKLHEAQEQLRADHAMNQGQVHSKQQASRKAEYDFQTAEHSLASMSLRAPSAGVVSLISIWHNGDETPMKAGERAWPGAPLAEIPDASYLRVTARVDETERGRLSLHQPVTVQLDAIPDRQFTGKLEQIGTIATMDFSAGWPIPRNFNLQIALDQSDPRLKPGMTANATIVVDRVPDAITMPTQAMFQKSGENVAYVWNGSAFREQSIQIGRTSRDRILVTGGLQAGDLVAMKDPTVKP